MNYYLPDEFGSEDGLPPGTSVLFRGPALSGKEEAAFRTVARGLRDGESALVVCFDNRPEDVVSALSVGSGLSRSSVASRVRIVNASVEEVSLGEEFRVFGADSPADLTGVGIGIGKGLDEASDGSDRVRILYDSVSTALMYRDTKTVYKFLRETVGDCVGKGALVVALLNAGLLDEEEGRIEGVFDGDVEFRMEGGSVEHRSDTVAGMARDWKALGGVGEAPRASEGATEGDGREGGAARSALAEAVPDEVGSLHELSEAVLGSRQTLTVFNHTGGTDLDDIREYFGRFNVDINHVEVDTETVDFAVLHKGSESLAAAPVAALGTAVDVETFGARSEDTSQHLGQVLLAHVDKSAFAARDVWKRFLIRMSRHIELRSIRSGSGVFHAGFQRLSRFYNQHRTRRVYSEIADTGVDVHLYGVRDIDDVGDIDDRLTVHAEDDEEIARTWFLVYDGPDDAATLVAEEQESGSYRGFWSFDPAVTEAAREYLEGGFRLRGDDIPEEADDAAD